MAQLAPSVNKTTRKNGPNLCDWGRLLIVYAMIEAQLAVTDQSTMLW